MKTSNLLIVSGLVLAGGFLFLRKKKPKTDTQELFKDNLIPNEPVEDISVNKISEKQALITPQEATVYATKTIAEVNSLMVKYPPLTKQQFVDNYNSAFKTDLIINDSGNIVATSVTPPPPIQGNGLQGLLNQLEIIKTSDGTASNVNNAFKGQQMIYTRFKTDFATVYSDLKNYYSTLTKEQADFIIKYLPKMIIRAFMGDNDPRARANDFYSQEEIIDMVDNSFVKNTDTLLEFALGNFFRNYKISIGEYSGEKTGLNAVFTTTQVDKYGNVVKN